MIIHMSLLFVVRFRAMDKRRSIICKPLEPFQEEELSVKANVPCEGMNKQYKLITFFYWINEGLFY